MEVMDIDDPPPLPDNVLMEIRRFIIGCTTSSSTTDNGALTSSVVSPLYSAEQSRLALHLLETLPCARSAVWEYLCNVFDEAVKCHLTAKSEKERASSTVGPALNSIVTQAQEVLLEFVSVQPEAWAPIISAWAIELLGQISSKYSQRCVKPNATLQDVFQMYTGCPASSALLEITSRCVSSLITTCPDLCVNELLNTAVRHAPAFDWVVAHVGSCFPKTIIARVLGVGLKDFCAFHVHAMQDGASFDNYLDNSPAAKMFAAKMNSVVGILNYLTSRGHKADIRFAIHSQFQESLSPLEDDAVDNNASASASRIDSVTLQYATLPYLLHLASLSPVLLKIVIADLSASFAKPAVLRQMTEHLERWTTVVRSGPDAAASSAMGERLLSMTVNLLVRIEDPDSALEVFKLLLKTADPESFATSDDDDDIPYIPETAKSAAVSILDHLSLRLQRLVYVSFKDKADVPFLIAIKRRWKQLCDIPLFGIGSPNHRPHLGSRVETAIVRLLTLVSLQSESLCISVLSTIILSPVDGSVVTSLFFPILSGVQNVTPTILTNVLMAVFKDISARREESVAYAALTNLDQLSVVERSRSSSNLNGLMPVTSLKSCLQKPEPLSAVARILASSYASCRLLRCGIQLLSHLDLANSSMSASTLLATAVTVNFFKLIAESSSKTAESNELADYDRVFKLVAQFLSKFCQRWSSIRTVVLRALLEGCLSREYSYLFSETGDDQSCVSISDSSQIGGHAISECVAPTPCLRDDNYALPSQRSGRTLPSGVIGQGLRKKNSAGDDRKTHRIIDDFARRNYKSLLMDVFYRCCSNQEIDDLSAPSTAEVSKASTSSKKLARLTLGKSATQSLSQLVVDLVCPESLNGACVGVGGWPEEDTIRHTVERDLLIKKRVQNHDVIVDVMDLVAKGGALSLIPCLPALRSWMAALLLFWDSNRDSDPGASANTWYYRSSLRLIKLMAVGGLLPHPLAHTDELFEFATPYERHSLLINIWRFMKETPLPADGDEDKLDARLRDVDDKFVENMRLVVNANIARANHLFGFLFPHSKKKITLPAS